jgi:hypothetical protein
MKIRKWYIMSALVIMIFVFTNPSLESFQRHVNPENKNHISTGRGANFVLFSTFRMNNGLYERRYIGVFNCFILTKTEFQFL